VWQKKTINSLIDFVPSLFVVFVSSLLVIKLKTCDNDDDDDKQIKINMKA